MRLEVDSVSKQYRGGVRALRDFSLELGPGVRGLLGPNGAGKSTLMRILATVTRPSSGTVRWQGSDIVASPDPLRRVLGYLPQGDSRDAGAVGGGIAHSAASCGLTKCVVPPWHLLCAAMVAKRDDPTAPGASKLWEDSPEGGVAMMKELVRPGRCLAVALLTVALAAVAQAKIVITQVKVFDVVQVADLDPGGSSRVSNLAVFDGGLYFAADDGMSGEELWRYDGNSAVLAADIVPGPKGSEPYGMMVFDGALYFSAEDAANGRELWRYEGNTATRITDIAPGPEPSFPLGMTEFQGALYFRAQDGVIGQELWRYDGSSASLVHELYPGVLGSHPRQLTVFQGDLYFEAEDGTSGRDLWRYDGSVVSHAGDLTSLGDQSFSPFFIVEYDGALYITDMDGGVECGDICKFDGSTLSPAADIQPGPPSSWPHFPVVFNDRLYFRAVEDVHGSELWRHNGTSAALAFEITPGADSSSPGWLTVFDGQLFMSATDGSTGIELYRGSQRVADVRPGERSSWPEWLTEYDGALYFVADDGETGVELWRFEYTDRVPRIYAEIEQVFERWWEWPIDPERQEIDPAAATAGFLAVTETGGLRLLARHDLDLNESRTVRSPLYRSAALDAEEIPPAMALVIVAFHDATGRQLTAEIEVVALRGELEERRRRRLEVQARNVVRGLTVERLEALRVYDFRVATTR